MFARRHHNQRIRHLTHRFAASRSSYRRPESSNNQVGCQAAALLILIWGAPLNHAGRTQILKRGQPGKDAGLAALGHGWPVAAAHGSGSAGGYTERQRGAEWWGKSVLVTFALFKSDAL